GLSRGSRKCRGSGVERLVFRYAVVDLIGPGGDAAFDALDVFEALLAQKLQGAEGADAAFTMDVVLLIRIELRKPLLQGAHREQRNVFDMRDVVLVRFAHIDDFNA